MKMINNIRNYLEDKDYYIDIFDDKLHVFNYIKLSKLTDTEIIILFNSFNLYISGSNIKVKKMNKTEILFKGKFNKLEIKNE